MTVLVGVSGKIGSGKNYLADRLIAQLRELGYTADYTSFAVPLKKEMDDILSIHRWYTSRGAGVTREEVTDISRSMDIPEEQVEVLLSYVADEVAANPALNAYDRTPGIRSALQYLGSEIRRSQHLNYWVDKLDESIKDEKNFDYLFTTDVRFPNEADYVLNRSGGVLFRLDVPMEVILSRTNSRDGLRYSEEALNHQSETSLDDYEKFDYFVGVDFNTSELVQNLLALSRERLTHGD